MFSGHNGKIWKSVSKIPGKSPSVQKLSNTVLNYPWIKEEIKGNEKMF